MLGVFIPFFHRLCSLIIIFSRSPSQPSSISLSYEAGTVSLFLQSIPEMQRSTSMILVHGSWDLQQRQDTASDLPPKSASVICTSRRYHRLILPMSHSFSLGISITCKLNRYVLIGCADHLYRSCPSPPAGVVSVKQQREKYRQRLLAAFESHYHPDHSVPRYVFSK